MISSLGGRWPKKLRSLPFLLGLLDGLSCWLTEAADDSGGSGICTPSPLRTLTELARLNALLPGVGALYSGGG